VSTPLARYLCPPGFAAPRLWALAGEINVVREAGALAWRRSAPDRVDAANGGPPVLLVPGLLAGDASLRPLAARLRQAGYPTYRSHLRANVGCAQAVGDMLERRLEEVVAHHQRPATIVGHSLGGLLAKSLAHRRPDLVTDVVTLASPLLAPGAVHQILAWDLMMLARLHRWGLGGLMSSDCTNGDCARVSWAQLSAPMHRDQRFTSVYSRRDGLIDWRACLHPAATHREVTCSHLGMAVDEGAHRQVLYALQPLQAVVAGEPMGAVAGA
jgi:triacylglycerol lipase